MTTYNTDRVEFDRIMKEKRPSLLNLDSIRITDGISIRIPTVGEILENEQSYYSAIHSLTAVPYQYMVQLDDIGLNFARMTDYELFQLLFPVYAREDLSLIFGDLYTADYKVYLNRSNSTNIIYSPTNGEKCQIDEYVYYKIVEALRKINLLERFMGKPGNEAARKYLIKKERQRQKRHANKPYEPYLEKLVIALVNSPEFKYDYDGVMNLSIYRFNQSFKQIQTRITFDKTMIGVYAGTVDTSKLSDRSCLSWIQIK